LEAMACGIPVISSNASSMPEVVGEAGLLIDPADESLWAEKLLLLFRDAELRRTFARLGLERSRIFTWQQTATRTMDVYRDVLGDVRGGGRG
jgi:glycosyltransferase involved in cell wall biosynthesis